MLRSDKFDGPEGEYNTVFNTIVRDIGLDNAIKLKSSKSVYDVICTSLYNRSKYFKNVKKQIVTHPNFHVPAFYGMPKSIKEKLDKKSNSQVIAYNTPWVKKRLNNHHLYKAFKKKLYV